MVVWNTVSFVVLAFFSRSCCFFISVSYYFDVDSVPFLWMLFIVSLIS